MNFVNILIAVVLFGFLIFIHEFGHYIMARTFRVDIKEFAIGMGPRILKKTSKKTGITYALRLLPIGGFVSMEGEDEDSENPNAFCNKPVIQRIAITVAGALTNIVLGFIFMAVIVSTTATLPSNVIAELPAGDNGINYSYEAGLREGDEIVKIGKTDVHIFNETIYEIMRNGIEPLDITVKRGGETVVLSGVVFPTYTEQGTTFGTIDFKVYAEQKTVGNVIKHSFFRSVSTVKMIWESLFDLIRGRYGIESVSGPIGVTKAIGDAVEQGWSTVAYFAVVISINLGIVNLLPLPALDGGRLLFQLIELVARRPIPRKIEGYIHFAGIIILFAFMIVIAVKDVVTLIR